MDENLLNLEQQPDAFASMPHPDGSEMPDDQEMMIAHVKPSEIISCNEMQGGESIDPELGIPEFRRLGKLFEIPEFKGLFLNHMREEMHQHHEDPELKYLKHIMPHPDMHDPKFHRPPGDAFPEVQMIEHDGHKGDTETAYFPVNVLDAFDEVLGGPSTNEDGLPQYGNFFKDIARGFSRALGSFGREALRTVAPIVGAWFGGPLGAGLGSAGAGLATGSNPMDALTRGLKIGALTHGLGAVTNYAAPGFMANNPGLASALGAGAGGALGGWGAPGGMLEGVSKFLGGTGSALGAQPAYNTGNVTKDILLNSGTKAPAAASSGLWDKVTSPLGILAASGLLMAHGHGKDQKAIKQAREDDKREREEHWKKMGMDTPLYNMDLPPVRMRTEPLDKEKLRHGIDQQLFYKKGGHVAPHVFKRMDPDSFVHIKGPGKGQDDVIDTDDVKHGDFIIDATTTAHTGDGSSEAGAEEWKKFMDNMTHKYLAKGGKVDSSPKPIVPASLSNDELKIPHTQVSALGYGDNKLGAKILGGMQDVIRSHKSSRGAKLPPPAKPLEQYMKQAMRLKGVA